MKKGDIFDWRYKDEKLHADYLNYWCCSRRGVVDDTHFVDTYWSDKSGARGVCTHAEAERKYELTFVANFEDLEEIPADDARYYRQEDIVDMSHSNSTRAKVYRRKGAIRNREVMLELAKRYQETWSYRAESANRDANECGKQILEMAAGSDLDKIYLREPK